jgi:hypothetical protein
MSEELSFRDALYCCELCQDFPKRARQTREIKTTRVPH